MEQTRQPRRIASCRLSVVSRQPATCKSESTSTSVALAGETVADVLARWPQTAPVFLHHRLACVGCSLARFELITDVPAIYGINPDRFLAELRQAIEGGYTRDNDHGPRESEGKAHEG